MIVISQDEADAIFLNDKNGYVRDINGNNYLLGFGFEILVISSVSFAEFEAQKALQEQKSKEAAINGA